MQSQEPGLPLAGSALLPQLCEVLFTTRYFPEIGGQAQGKMGSVEGWKAGGQHWARESAGTERKQVAEVSLPPAGPVPCPLPGNIPQSGLASPSRAKDSVCRGVRIRGLQRAAL